MRKLVLLAAMALAAVAFAVPASASASTWTVEGAPLYEGETWNETYQGSFGYSVNVYGKFQCSATIELELEGGTSAEAATAKIVKFERVAKTCSGSGFFWANCKLASGSSNVASGWNVNVTPPTPELTSPSGEIVVTDKYEGCTSGATGRTTRFREPMELIPTLNAQNRITGLALEGKTVGLDPGPYGVFTAVAGSPALGLQ
jgi:hypothetical protein